MSSYDNVTTGGVSADAAATLKIEELSAELRSKS